MLASWRLSWGLGKQTQVGLTSSVQLLSFSCLRLDSFMPCKTQGSFVHKVFLIKLA